MDLPTSPNASLSPPVTGSRDLGLMRVLIVDDSSTNVAMMNALVRVAGAEPFSFNDPIAALVEGANIKPDLAIVDYQMPSMNGIELTAALRMESWARDIPIVMITSNEESAIRHRALEAGSTDFLRRPIDPIEVKARIKNLLKLSEAQKKIADKASWLADEIAKATRMISDREAEIIMRLARAADYRDGDTGSHIVRMSLYCSVIAQGLNLDKAQCDLIYRAAPLHDVGKIGISDNILLKAGPLDPEERLQIEKHTLFGEAILSGSSSDLIKAASEIAAAHHERWDGTGYPRKLKGEEIPLAARIVAVADVFDALTSQRPYKRAWSLDDARNAIVAGKGTHFDPACVEAFLRNWDVIVGVHLANDHSNGQTIENQPNSEFSLAS
jgi:response regulator RpfG family c-di-GMP phosphodiesterase